jgi:aminopeptidase N
VPDASPRLAPHAQDPHRLPRTVLPSRYDLTLEPDLDAATFRGTVAISVMVYEATMSIVLNAAELEIDEAWVERDDGRRIDARVELDPGTERAVLNLIGTLLTGAATVHLKFRGTLNDKLVGFYRSRFVDDDGNERTLAVTQMEATHARKAFPCWDEPELKAVFGVTLVVDEDLLAISNSAEVARDPAGEGKVAVLFQDTIPMSTYLVAFVVGPLEVTAPVDAGGVPLRLVHPPGRAPLSQYALEVGAFCLRYFTEWFGIPYAGGKLDLVAIPDFGFGAMENLGCVTFRERLVLIDPATSTQAELQAVVDVIAHELAHMWFGDLVTMKWWNGIWLNEAFATFMEMKATDAFRPDWERWVHFGLSRTAAFDTDALLATRPIEYPVVSPEEAEGMFDVLTYEKGASVVRMLEQFLGEDAFQDGLRRYMAKHQYGNAETTDLWDALQEASGQPVRSIADTWIFKGGFPEVSVEVVDGTRLRLSQRRFRYDAGSVSGEGGRWAVPVLFGFAVDDGDGDGNGNGNGNGEGVDVRDGFTVLDAPVVELDMGKPIEWINANQGGHGFYRVRYEASLLDQLVEGRALLSPLERYVLVDDTWAGVLAGTVPAEAFLAFAERFGDETDLAVWERLVGGLTSLERLLEDDARTTFATRVRALLAPARERLGPDPQSSDDDRARTLRGVLLGAAALVGQDEDARADCDRRLEAYLANPAGVDPSLATAALGAGAALGDTALHDRLVERFSSTANPQDRERLLWALARFYDPDCLRRTLELALSDRVRTQDAPFVLREAVANRDNGAAAWAFVSERWDDVNSRFPTHTVPRMISGIRSLRQRGLAAQVETFLLEHPLPQGEMQVQQHIERMWVSVLLAERESSRFEAALRA